MRKIQNALLGLIASVLAVQNGLAVEATWEYAVQVSATVQTSPAQINLSWPQDSTTTPNSYTVYRKGLNDTSWGSGTSLPGTATSYTDNNVAAGSAYEYQIVKSTSLYNGYGYIYAGVNAPLIESRGKLILIVDQTYAADLTNELGQLQQDLIGDGWTILRHDVGRTDSVTSVKALIQADYNADPNNVNAVFLFGHVPVPYSGNIVPDGHVPGHQGAWPADAYYGDMHGTWTDNSVNITGADDVRNHNVPGDGKFDQSVLPAPIDLMVGRVDLANLPGQLTWGGPATFPTEKELLRNYLNKDHRFRFGQMAAPRRGLVGDYFGIRNGEAFAASGWRNFAPFVGANNITFLPNQGTWIPTLSNNTYLWAYGCGAGSYTSVGGLGNTGQYNDGVTPELVNADIHAVFTLLFGSWFGDWDSQDDIMRAVLAVQDYGLTCAWSGRPHWFMHHMALGLPIGYSARLTQNNHDGGLYQTQINSAAGNVHVALMGDPALRMHPVLPAGNLSASPASGGVRLNWSVSSDAVVGYHVYHASSLAGPFTRLTSSTPLNSTTFVDTTGASGSGVYMVRAVKLETSASGTYFNPSQGVFINGNGSTTGLTNPIVTTTNTPPPVTTTNTPPPATNSPATGAVSSPTNAVLWVDDATPAGAQLYTAGGDSWSWISNNPAPYSGKLAHQSAIAAGLHQQYFDWAPSTLQINPGGELFTYVYLDPANPPSEVLLEWNNGTWDHRAYWGANNINNGTNGTASRYYMGPLPAAGAWTPLVVPASLVNLEGSSLRGMTFTLYNGRATWDCTGTAPLQALGTTTGSTNTSPSSSTPAGTNTLAGTNTPSGTSTNQPGQTNITGLVIKSMSYVPPKLQLSGTGGTPGGKYAILDSTSPTAPGTNWISIATNSFDANGNFSWSGNVTSTSPRLFFSVRALNTTNAPPVTNTNTPTTTNTPPSGISTNLPLASTAGTTVWVDDAAPAGAQLYSAGGDSWNWVGSNPTPYSGTLAHQSAIAAGAHQDYFDWAPNTLQVNTGDELFTCVYLDPTNPPSEIILEWNNGTWDHRAYWGANNITTNKGTNGTASRYYMGPLPAAGKWAPLIVPASLVNLEGSSVRGMAFTLYNGRATWDYSGSAPIAAVTNQPPVTTPPTNSPPTGTPPTNNTPPPTNTPPIVTTNAPGGISVVDDASLKMPTPGQNTLHILTPTMLELVLINSQPNNSTPPSTWNFVNSGSFQGPSASKFTVTVNGQQVAVQSVGFKRRPLSAPLATYDLRIENSLYLQLASPIQDNQNVVVANPDGSVFSSGMQFSLTANPRRYSPAIHVNQEGYVPSFPKKAMVGYYAGDKGELTIPASTFVLVDVNSGAQVFQGSLTQRKDSGWTYSPTPYQQVYQADFSSFSTPGEYQLVVPGMGGSLPFLITDGIAMDFARAYALGMYHQRCGTANAMPYTRFTHGPCHTAPASIPVPDSNPAYAFTWKTIAGYSGGNSTQTAPQLTSQASSLFPIINTGTVDVSGGHHDAGDYSKYTINVASLTHYLMFAADSLNGVAALDNLGTPESGDGISDVMQEAKWEADYLCKLQDADGGFYFIVYPINREYESNVTPDHGDPQVVWPKNTASSAAAVAALAECASSPKMKAAYPADAAKYLAKAKAGWQFLMNAINKYGKNGAYQKITFYGDDFNDADELAWAATEMYLATGDQTIHQKLLSWFNPTDSSTWRWGWEKMFQCYGNAIRSYVFAVRSGRVQASALDATFLAKCQSTLTGAADDALRWTQISAYGTSFPDATKAVNAAGWFFSEDQAFDIMVAYQLNPKPEYLDAMIANMNYEGGCNPVNMTYLTGLGWRRQRVIVSQYALNDGRIMPPSGEPIGNVQDGFPYLSSYQSTLGALCYPSDGASPPYPFYDRWGDTWNVSTEMVGLNEARGLATTAALAAMTQTKTQPYTAKAGTITLPAQMPVNVPVTATFQAPAGMDLTGARVVWEASGQEPAYGPTFTFTPTTSGALWVEAEAQWPDGRRAFATSGNSAFNNLPTVSVVANIATASRATQNLAEWTFTRTGSTSSPLTVNFQFTGSAVKWNDYRRPQGDMPESITIPAGAATATLDIYAVSGTTWTGAETAILNISTDPSYNAGTPGSATITLN